MVAWFHAGTTSLQFPTAEYRSRKERAALFNAGKSVRYIHLACSNRLDFGPSQLYPALKAFSDFIIPSRLLVSGNLLQRRFLWFLSHISSAIRHEKPGQPAHADLVASLLVFFSVAQGRVKV